MKCASKVITNIAVTCGLLITSNVMANNTLSQPHSLGHSQMACDAGYRIKMNEFSAAEQKENAFIFSSRYCINSLAARNFADKATLPERRTVRHLLNRYNDTYDSLQSYQEKVAFVDLFLTKVTQKYHTSLNENNFSKDSVQIIINSVNSGKTKVSGYAVTLFRGDNISEDIAPLFSQYLAQTGFASYPKAIVDKVNFVLEGRLKKLKNQDSKARVVSRSEDDEDDDLTEEWEEEDQEYRDWAEEQADGWGDDWDYFWTDGGDEEWLVMFNEESGDVEEAYHFNPKAD